ncbi:sensor histidine kinase [Oxalobacteraceae bacterium R-40]|uniref:histidine kinase n=1 Tax=Keguizhuia sedimenti TaxID=3064264 RepID=A0ABU1BIU5_9BURK|nr:sensor histidine kinase [Oxalobacteraceae bacterium R-40]
MSIRLLHVEIASERDVIAIRKRTREIAAYIGFGVQDQARVATAVSEIAQNAFTHAYGGRVEFFICSEAAAPSLLIRVSDNGPGIPDLEKILNGAHDGPEKFGVGIVGAQRLLDQCEVETGADRGTTVTMVKQLPKGSSIGPAQLDALNRHLAATTSSSVLEEDQLQHKELLQTMAELRSRQDELVSLTRELEDTNRGVVALYAEIEEKAERLRHADAMKSRFLSNTSHELRTPLSSIRALSQLLLDRVDGELTAAQEKQILFIQKAANDLSELVNDLLDLAKIEAGKVDVSPSDFTVYDLFSMLRGMLRPLTGTRPVELVFDETHAEWKLYTDESKVTQILRNLISNALKFTEQGEVRVHCEPDERGNNIRFMVSDTGIGIAESNLQLIFEEFSQVENPLQKSSKGTGLGLPLCRKLAGLLGGTIEVSSRLDTGSTFSLSIPPVYSGKQGMSGAGDESPRIEFSGNPRRHDTDAGAMSTPSAGTPESGMQTRS